MKTIYSAILFLISAIYAYSQPTKQWEKSFDATTGTDKGNVITIDANGNVYVGATSDGMGTGSDYLTIKYNSNGDTVWSKRYNGIGNGNDEIKGIKVDASGNVYVTGKSQGVSSSDILTVKYNSTGNQLWAKRFNGTGNLDDIGYALVLDGLGNSYIAGSTYDSGSNFTYGTAIKYNANGDTVWTRRLFHAVVSYDHLSNLIGINSAGNIVISEYENSGQGTDHTDFVELSSINGSEIYFYGWNGNPWGGFPASGFCSAMAFDGSSNIYALSTEIPGIPQHNRIEVTNYTHFSGNIWNTFFTGQNNIGDYFSSDIKVDANSNIYVSGYTDSDPSALVNYDILTLKLNSLGDTLWSRKYNAPANLDDKSVSIAINSNSNPSIFVTGYTTTANGLHDFTSIKYSNSGTQQWVVNYDCGNNGDDIASSMVRDNFDNLYITGFSDCNGTSEDCKTVKYCTTIPNANTNLVGATITASTSGATYQWIDSTTSSIMPAAISQSFTPTQNGTYAVIVNQFGCSATSAYVHVTTVGINTIDENNSIQLFPNPASTKIYFKNLKIDNSTIVTVENIYGEKIIEIELKNQEINISNLPPSLYIVKIQNKAGLSLLKFLKE